jgi:hypothetical protein
LQTWECSSESLELLHETDLDGGHSLPRAQARDLRDGSATQLNGELHGSRPQARQRRERQTEAVEPVYSERIGHVSYKVSADSGICCTKLPPAITQLPEQDLRAGTVKARRPRAPGGGGYGGPTLFFAIQGVGMLMERSRFGHEVGLGRGVRGWFFTMLARLLPAPLLFHPRFVEGIVVPFMHSLRAL